MKRDRVVTAGVVLIQKTFRGHRCRKRYVQLRASTITLQKHWRAFAAKRRYKRVSVAIVSILGSNFLVFNFSYSKFV